MELIIRVLLLGLILGLLGLFLSAPAPIFVFIIFIMFLSVLATAERKSETARVLLEAAEKQNMALAKALRLADVLRRIDPRKTSSSVERARAGLRRGSKSAPDITMEFC